MEIVYRFSIVVVLLMNLSFKAACSGKFPDDFIFGVASASYQVEGGWNATGKGENIWDRITHTHPEYVKDKTNGDIACDSYHKVDEDIEILKDLGVDFYRFSLSWSRLLPSGFADRVNEDGVRYYNSLIDGLLKAGIKPFVTLYHWDLPQPLQDIGGWPNPLMVDYFEDYARIAFQLFGDRVKLWITFNEPIEVCEDGYALHDMAPAYTSQGIGDYLCAHTLLKAHARVYHAYQTEFRNAQKGQVGITIDTEWYEPKTNKTADIAAAKRALDMDFGWYVHPIYSKEGDYPSILKERVANLSRLENFPRSRLPSFTAEEIDYIRGSYDFLGLNHYSTLLVSEPGQDVGHIPSHSRDISATLERDPSWPSSASSWLKVVPWGFYKLLMYLKSEYEGIPIYVTENGYSDRDGLDDEGRVNYYTGYLKELARAIENGCNVKGYTAWSIMDNFEWMSGYTERFGLYYVNFLDPNRTRTAKKSASVYKNIIKTHIVDDAEESNKISNEVLVTLV